MASLYEMPLTKLSGIGAARAALFEKLGIRSVGELIRFYPRSYENWSEITPISELVHGEKVVVKARVASAVSNVRLPGGRLMAKVKVADDSGYMTMVFFNNRYIDRMLTYGEEYCFLSKAQNDGYGFQMVSPEFSKATESEELSPIYPLTAGLNNHMVIRAVKQALALLPDVINDPMPFDVMKRYQLESLSFALNNIHFPKTLADMEKARHRLVFEELLVLNLGMRLMKDRTKEKTGIRMQKNFVSEFTKTLPFSLTGAQQRAITDCVNDMMHKTSPMNRLIQGDVGSGKTAVCAALCYNTVKNGYQAAFMAPTEILAAQHFETFSKMFEGTGMTVELLTGAQTQAQKKKIRERIQSGESDIIIGTHALISESTVFARLGCAITDEQHRFGVTQRSKLAEKGEHPHVLVLSATPIPRTLGLIIYGDLDISIIDEMPPGRKEVKTYLIDSSKRARALGFLKDQVKAGRQCYIVTPLVEEGESDLASAENYAEQLMLDFFSDIPVGILHGKMKAKEKDAVMDLFSKNELSILVSTTVVEVGVDVKNATVMMVENAERFGLSTLHQLRGRVGRGEAESYCILVSDNRSENTEHRLKTMCRTSNGFEIADEDLRLRGPGDFFGSRQHGLPKLMIADFSDIETLEASQQAAQEILSISPDLSADGLGGLRAQIRQLFSNSENAMN